MTIVWIWESLLDLTGPQNIITIPIHKRLAILQVQDQTVSFVPKILAMAGVLIACLPWLVTRMVEFTRTVFENAGSP